MFSLSALITALIVFLARVCDVSLGTLRHVMIIRGKKAYAFGIAFFESLIWIFAVSRVLAQVSDPITAAAFALGFATGTWAGMTLEGVFKIGEQVVRIISREGDALAEELRSKGYRVTVIDGRGRDGAVQLLFVQVRRRNAHQLARIARARDKGAFILFDDIRSVHPACEHAGPEPGI